jgi:hypothetical protein
MCGTSTVVCDDWQDAVLWIAWWSSVEVCTYLLLGCWSVMVVLPAVLVERRMLAAYPHGSWLFILCQLACIGQQLLRAQHADAATFECCNSVTLLRGHANQTGQDDVSFVLFPCMLL